MKQKTITEMKTSVMERNIGKHTHEVDIYNSYEIYAVCRKCRKHDWDIPSVGEDNKTREVLQRIMENRKKQIEFLKKKYPKNYKVIEFEL